MRDRGFDGSLLLGREKGKNILDRHLKKAGRRERDLRCADQKKTRYVRSEPSPRLGDGIASQKGGIQGGYLPKRRQ